MSELDHLADEQAPTDLRRVEEALAATGTGTWRWDAASGVVVWDHTLERLAGLEPGSFAGTFEAWADLLHPDDRDAVLGAVDDAVARRAPYLVEHRFLRPDGAVVWVEGRGRVTVDDDGAVTGAIGSTADVTARKVAELDRLELVDRLDRLQRLGGALAAAVTRHEVGRAVVDHLLTPNTSGSRSLWVPVQGGEVLELEATAGLAAGAARRFERIDVHGQLPAAVAFREQRTIVSTSSDDAVGRFPTLADQPRSATGFLALPLVVEGRSMGVVAVGFDADELPEVDLRYFEAAAGHLAQTLARVSLSEGLMAAARRERYRREQVEFLSRLTDVAIEASDHRELMAAVAGAAVPRLGDWCSLHFTPPEGDVTIEVAHVEPEKVSWARQLIERYPYDPDAPSGVAAVIRTGEPELISEITAETVDAAVSESQLADDEARAVIETLAPTSLLAVPLVSHGEVIGAMQFISTQPERRYDEDDLALAEAGAGRIADALAGMWRADQDRRTAAVLQRSLLPPDLPAVPGVEVASRYYPAGTTHEVGGDFYDLFAVDDGGWVMLIGDVTGSGPDAAALTSIVRHTVRAAARHGADLDEILAWANEAVLHSDRSLLCTACCGLLEAREDGWRLRVALAGHPHPVLRRADGDVEPLGVSGTLLGAFDTIRTETVEVALAPGDVVLAYTDGVTDLPGGYGATVEDVAVLVDRLAAGGGSADQVADGVWTSVVERVPDESRLDDVALLVLRVLPTAPARAAVPPGGG